MAFYITDQGMRSSTPLAELVRGRQVDAINAVAATGSATARNGAVGGSVPAGVAPYTGSRRSPRQPARYAQQLMSHPVQVMSIERLAGEAWQLMQEQRIHHLPLVDDAQRLAGIVSDRDLLRAGIAATHSAAGVALRPLSELMTRRVISAGHQAELRALAEVMVGQRIGAVPIVDGEHRVVGLVSRSDILTALIVSGPLELWA